MVSHLIQSNFKPFGSVSPERLSADRPQSTPKALSAVTGSTTIYRTTCPTWLYCGTVSTVLSVSADNDRYEHFYLDKPVRLHKGIAFCLTALRGTSAAVLYALTLPTPAGSRTRTEDFSVHHLLHVKSLYTFFYHEKEQGFLFAGEAHPMLELTYVDQGSLHSVADG